MYTNAIVLWLTVTLDRFGETGGAGRGMFGGGGTTMAGWADWAACGRGGGTGGESAADDEETADIRFLAGSGGGIISGNEDAKPTCAESLGGRAGRS